MCNFLPVYVTISHVSQVPGGMKRRVLRWYDYSWSRGRIQGGGDINTALGLLPDKLKTELALHVNLSVLKKVCTTGTWHENNKNYTRIDCMHGVVVKATIIVVFHCAACRRFFHTCSWRCPLVVCYEDSHDTRFDP